MRMIVDVVAIFLFVNVIGIFAGTNFDISWTHECPSGQSISTIRSVHSNHHEDRSWSFYCRYSTKITTSCSWTGYVNGFDDAILYQCPNGVISGIQSYHSNHHEDRRFKFKCCSTKNNAANSCYWTGYVNGWDGYMNYLVSYGYYLVGAYSIHDNKREDRRWRFLRCKQG